MNDREIAAVIEHAGPNFDVGDRIVHPHHGAGVVVGRESRPLLGRAREYLEIKLDTHALTIMVPCESAAAVGLRGVMDDGGLARLTAVLEAEPDLASLTWPVRQKLYRERLRDGDVLELAALVRDLAVRESESGLPSTERQLYDRSRRILVSELRHALGVDPEGASAYLDEHLACGPPARAGNEGMAARAPHGRGTGSNSSPGPRHSE